MDAVIAASKSVVSSPNLKRILEVRLGFVISHNYSLHIKCWFVIYISYCCVIKCWLVISQNLPSIACDLCLILPACYCKCWLVICISYCLPLSAGWWSVSHIVCHQVLACDLYLILSAIKCWLVIYMYISYCLHNRYSWPLETIWTAAREEESMALDYSLWTLWVTYNQWWRFMFINDATPWACHIA